MYCHAYILTVTYSTANNARKGIVLKAMHFLPLFAHKKTLSNKVMLEVPCPLQWKQEGRGGGAPTLEMSLQLEPFILCVACNEIV